MSHTKIAAKHAVLNAFQYLRINSLLRVYERSRVLVLCYHRVVSDRHCADRSGYGNVIGVTEFSEHMRVLSHFYNPISTLELRDWFCGTRRLPRNPVLVTFDDGYRNNLTYAAPVLTRFGIPALINICAGYIGRSQILWIDEIYLRVFHWPKSLIPMPDSPIERPVGDCVHQRAVLAEHIRQYCKTMSFDDALEYLVRLRGYDLPEPDEEDQERFAFLCWDEVRKLVSQGFQIGSHTVGHPLLSRLRPDQLPNELRQSKTEIEQKLSTECFCIAYPEGSPASISNEVRRCTREAGYILGFTTTARFCSATDDPFTLGRTSIPGNLTGSEFHSRLSGLHARLHRLPKLAL
jgi:peptidoglycan/xylan/chitin deacetylase (PgdA/CDA1 family)